MELMKLSLKINEIFYSIQGESTYAGLPTIFIRTTACNLRCSYCDTTYAFFEGKPMSLHDIFETIAQFKSHYVCITGGEPLLQKNTLALMTALCDRGYKVSLETNGSVTCVSVDPRVKIVIDVKTPDSGAQNSFLLENLKFLNVNSEIKFVICSENDFFWAENFVKINNLSPRFTILYGPSFGKVDEKWLAEKIISQNSTARLQLQLHKYIWSSTARGV